MKNRILLIYPPNVIKRTSFMSVQFPLNIAGIAAYLLEKGYDVRIWDFLVESFNEVDFGREIKEFRPFIVGISCYTSMIINGHKIATLVKKYVPEAIIIIGGPHVSALPEETMNEFCNFDIGVVGEGEETLVELADKLLNARAIEDTKGIVYRKNGIGRRTGARDPIRNLDNLPFPARQLLNMALYKGQADRGFSRTFLRLTEMITSRGCPNRCIFCASGVVMNDTVRFRSSDSVRREIAECIEKFGFNHFVILDDTFLLKEDRVYDICEEFARRKVTWNCNTRVWPISKKMLLTMRASGCLGITFGVESGSQRILKLIKKNITVEQIEAAFRLSKEAGIKLIEADIVIGSHPSETEEDIKMTEKLLDRISPDIVMIAIIVPYPGTEVYTMMKEKNLIFQDRKWNTFVQFGKEPSWMTEHFGPKRLVQIQKNMLFHFYLRPKYIFRMLRKMRSIREAVYWFRGGIEFLFNCIVATIDKIKL